LDGRTFSQRPVENFRKRHRLPFFKVKAGNFKDRKEAEDYQKKLNSFFPNGVFIMSDLIELKPEKEAEEIQ